MSAIVSPSAAPAAPSEAPAAGGNLAANAPKAPSAPGNAPVGAKDTAPKADLSPKAPSAVPEAPKAPEKRKYKLNIDGQTHEAEYSDDQIAVELQKSRAAQKRFEEAAKTQKAWQQLREEGKKDPRLLLKEVAGIENPREWAEKLLAEEWQREVMTPEQKAAAERDQELQTYKQKVEAYEAQQRQQFEAQQQQQLEQQIEADVKQAFELSGFEFNGENLEAFVKVMSDALEYGVELTPAQVVAQVKAQHEERDSKFSKSAKEKLLGLKGDALLSELGDDVVREILRASIAKHDTKAAENFAPAAPEPEKTELPQELKARPANAWRKLGR